MPVFLKLLSQNLGHLVKLQTDPQKRLCLFQVNSSFPGYGQKILSNWHIILARNECVIATMIAIPMINNQEVDGSG